MELKAVREIAPIHKAQRISNVILSVILFQSEDSVAESGPVRCRERLGGLLKYCHRDAG